MRKISSFALFAFILPLAGCPGDDSGETEGMATTTMTPATDTVAEPATDTVAEPATDTVAEPTETAADTTAGGGGEGFCSQTCTAPADCGAPETDWACTEGFCEFIGTLPEPPPCDDTTCPAAIGGACANVNGVNQCTFPCTEGGTECDALMLECTGVNDDGNSICAAPPCGGAAEGAPCELPMGGGQYGVCTEGVCSCTDNSECTVAGQGCNTNAGA